MAVSYGGKAEADRLRRIHEGKGEVEPDKKAPLHFHVLASGGGSTTRLACHRQHSEARYAQ